MKSTVPITTAKTGYLVISILLFAFGLCVVITPKTFRNIIGVVIAIALIIFGIIKMIGYFSKDLFRLAFQYDLAFGLLLVTLGIIVLMKPENIINFLCVAIGVAILADGLFKIQMSLDAKAFGIEKWWLIFVIAAVTGVVGLLLVFRPFAGSLVLLRILGAALMAYGLMNSITVLTAVKIIKHQKPDVLEGKWREL